MCDWQNERAGYPDIGDIQPFWVLFGGPMGVLPADSEHFRTTGRADALGRRSLVLHDDALGIPHFLLGTALHTVCSVSYTHLTLPTTPYV